MRLNSYAIHAAIFIILITTSCVGTKPKKGTISGNLYLDGESAHSGITVMLFSGNIISDDIKTVNTQYSQIAFAVNDEHIFDHRKYQSLQTIHTSQSGAFTFSAAEYNKYIVVFFKEGWGFRYLFDIELNSSDLDLSDHFSDAELTLNPIVEVPSTIIGEYLFDNNRCYHVSQDVLALEGSNLIFGNNSVIMLDPGKNFTIYGNVIFPMGNQYSSITSSSNIYLESTNNTATGGEVFYFGQTNFIHNVLFSYMSTALNLKVNSINIETLLVRDSAFGIISYRVDDITISKSIFLNNTDPDAAALYNTLVNNIDINDCLFYNNYISIIHEITTEAIVHNNIFINGTREFVNLWDSAAIFSNNIIKNQGVGIENSGRSNLDITYNDIHANVCVQTYHSNNWYNTINAGWTKASNNNFQGSQYVVESMARYFYEGSVYPLDFKQNYWNVTSASSIDALIYDEHDLGDPGEGWVWSEVIYAPFKISQIVGTGVR